MLERAISCRASSAIRFATWGMMLATAGETAFAQPPDGVVVQFAPVAGAAEKPAAKEPEEKKDAKLGASDAAAKVNDGQVLGFRQAEVAAQMTELEERMFRLAEAIKQLEPENSSRLILGLKFAREELILYQMKETQQLLDKLNLGEAMAEEKHLLSKLQRLHDMLLSADLDLQMRLERLRQLREILRRLDKAIVEEEREQKQSTDTAGLAKEVSRQRESRASLEALVKRQKSHVEQGRKLAGADAPGDDSEKSIDKLAQEQATTRTDAQKLSKTEADAGAKLEHLDQAIQEMAEAGESFDAGQAAAALPRQQLALESLQRQLQDLAKQLEEREVALGAEKFTALQKDQAANHQFTDAVTDSVRALGDMGAVALGSLQSSTGSMAGAEKELGQRQPEPASSQQASAVESLKQARKQLSGELAKLLDQLRAEVKRRVLEDLTMMLEKQIAIRESTAALGARVKDGGRQVLASIIALSASEGRIVAVADELLALVEETEFGIALPAALTMVRDAMAGVKESLAAADASEPVVLREREIEADLKDLLLAMKQLPSKSSSDDPQDGDGGRERELNRLVAELKMIRLVQVRVNRSTVATDDGRPAQLDQISADLRRRIENVTNQQDDVRDVTERLFSERAVEIQ